MTLHHGDCLDVLPTLEASSIDAVVTDPPYGLEFMGRAWDRFTPLDYEAWCAKWAAECLRVLKPGGHLLAFGGTRTAHRLAAGIEDAGFELRDSIAWLYGSGFPKSLDVSKAIDKTQGQVGARGEIKSDRHAAMIRNGRVGAGKHDGWARDAHTNPDAPAKPSHRWGTALKPAHEPIVVARKPLAGTVAGNVLAYGTGALNIDACRVAGDGRWPPNVVLDESQAAELDRLSGVTTSGAAGRKGSSGFVDGYDGDYHVPYGDTGGASRFFPTFRYEAKAPVVERPRNGEIVHPTVKPLDLMRWLVRLVTPRGGTVLDPFLGSGTTAEACVIEGFEWVGIEREADYLPLIEARLTKPLQVALDL